MPEQLKHQNPYHPDVWLFLILIPLISAFNYYLTYTHIQLNWFLLLTFSIDTAQGYVAWWGVRSFIFFLDKKQPFENGPSKRVVKFLYPLKQLPDSLPTPSLLRAHMNGFIY